MSVRPMITRRSRCATSLRLAGREEEEEEEEEAGPRIKSGVTKNGMAATGWFADRLVLELRVVGSAIQLMVGLPISRFRV